MATPIQPGDVFGQWAVQGRTPNRGNKLYFLCRCSCGVEQEIQVDSLRRGLSTRCKRCKAAHVNAAMRKDLTGQTFHRWTVLRIVEGDGCGTDYWCRCVCGHEGKVEGDTLRRGRSKGCKVCAVASRQRKTLHIKMVERIGVCASAVLKSSPARKPLQISVSERVGVVDCASGELETFDLLVSVCDSVGVADAARAKSPMAKPLADLKIRVSERIRAKDEVWAEEPIPLIVEVNERIRVRDEPSLADEINAAGGIDEFLAGLRLKNSGWRALQHRAARQRLPAAWYEAITRESLQRIERPPVLTSI